VLHKVDGDWANTAFSFTGDVDRKRVKREILRAFKRGGQVVHPSYIEASIQTSLDAATRHHKALLGQAVLNAALDTEKRMEDISLAERAHLEQRQFHKDEYASQT
jgi:hypothetical protein